jgi:hypothetical protein
MMLNQPRFIFPFLLLFLNSCGPIWKSPPYYTGYPPIELPVPILTMEDYSKRSETHPRPYIVEAANNTGAVLLFGAEHTSDPNDPQIPQIKSRWKEFKPTVALVESRLGFLFRWTMDPLRRYGEAGLVLDLAKSEGIPFYTWEPVFEEEISWMLKKYPRQQVGLFYVLRPFFGANRQRMEDPDGFVQNTIEQRTRRRGLEGSIRNVAEIDSIWGADFPGMVNWRDTSDVYGWPGYLNVMAAESNAYRDEHFIRVILDLVRKGHRVFAVAGSSHAVKLDEALKTAINMNN